MKLCPPGHWHYSEAWGSRVGVGRAGGDGHQDGESGFLQTPLAEANGVGR